MLPVKNTSHTYRTLEEICQRKDELADQISNESTRFTTLWNDAFNKNENPSKGEYIASLVSKGFIAFDAFMMVRKLMKTYGFLTGWSNKKKKRK